MIVTDSGAVPTVWRRSPAWVRGGADDSTEDVHLRAGAALALLDAEVRRAAAWRGAWLDRLALEAAAATLRLVRRAEDIGEIRDAHHLRRPGDDPGPAGRIYALWRRLPAGRPSLDPADLAHGLERSGLSWSDDLDRLATAAAAAPADRSPLSAALHLLAAVPAPRLDDLPAVLWIADTLLARRARWPVGVPLLARAAGPLTRGTASGSAQDRLQVVAAYGRTAVEALGMARAVAAQATALQGVAGRLRAKGAPAVIAALLDQDSVSPGQPIRHMTDRALRRLFDRLVALGAVRELTGRGTFRLYGL
ncbi:MAG: DUF1403 family protein [Parvibaculum sp.]